MVPPLNIQHVQLTLFNLKLSKFLSSFFFFFPLFEPDINDSYLSMALITGMAGTLLGPLTASIPLPDHCRFDLFTCSTCSLGFRGQQCSTAIGNSTGQPMDDTSCWPPAPEAVPALLPLHGWGFYSPGLACPTGYTTACTARFGGRSEWSVQFTLVPGEVAVGCCPEYVGNYLAPPL